MADIFIFLIVSVVHETPRCRPAKLETAHFVFISDIGQRPVLDDLHLAVDDITNNRARPSV